MTEIEVRVGDNNICDFCSEPEPTRTLMVEDFPMDKTPGQPEYRSKGAWVACATCASMIDGEHWDRLLQRAVNHLGPKYDTLMPRRILTDTIKRSHDLFRAHYKAKP